MQELVAEPAKDEGFVCLCQHPENTWLFTGSFGGVAPIRFAIAVGHGANDRVDGSIGDAAIGPISGPVLVISPDID